ncbi:hypothetical protein B6N60_02371 [Richelia sinica FACHB-800]|uniref:Uncharacterized protein n=1 Tax=Richelia sinica FACHB-800 TaxID=1357546 RepID=A0A975T976_9NOST|nr:hypothetical protein B6N60_02371 [Richelia sinica FACHB-800]
MTGNREQVTENREQGTVLKALSASVLVNALAALSIAISVGF